MIVRNSVRQDNIRDIKIGKEDRNFALIANNITIYLPEQFKLNQLKNYYK